MNAPGDLAHLLERLDLSITNSSGFCGRSGASMLGRSPVKLTPGTGAGWLLMTYTSCWLLRLCFQRHLDRAGYQAEYCKGLHGRVRALRGLGPEGDENLSGRRVVPEPILDGGAAVASRLHGLGLVVIRLQLVAGELQCFTIVSHRKVMPRPELRDFGDELIGQCSRPWTARKANRTDKSFEFRPEIVVGGVTRIILQHRAVIAFEQIEGRNQDAARQELSVEVPRLFRVELVDAIGEERPELFPVPRVGSTQGIHTTPNARPMTSCRGNPIEFERGD
jgi:hypothetical protein